MSTYPQAFTKIIFDEELILLFLKKKKRGILKNIAHLSLFCGPDNQAGHEKRHFYVRVSGTRFLSRLKVDLSGCWAYSDILVM